jgi:hypothetical protein
MSGGETASDRDLLAALGTGGLSEVPVMLFDQVATECERRARTTGDARFPILEWVFAEIGAWWDDQGVDATLAGAIESELTHGIPLVLSATNPVDGYTEARALAVAIGNLTGVGPS